MTPTYTTIGPAVPEPMRGEPVALPVRTENDDLPARVLVHTELGVPIYFHPASAQFRAQIGPVEGKGENAELHSTDFTLLVERIRERALVVPVQGYLVSINHHAETDEEIVRVQACTVIEYHSRRQQPFVVRLLEEERQRRWGRPDGSAQMVERIRPVSDVMLPEPHHIQRILAVQKEVLAEERRHEIAKRSLQAELQAALAAIPRLTGRDLQRVQRTGQQVAQAPEAVGALVFDLTDETEED